MRGLVVDRSVHLDARNRKCPKGLNNVPCVGWSWIVACNLLHEIMRHAPRLNHSCIKMHATGKSVNHVPRLIIRATSCTLRGNHELRTAVESFVQQVARYGEIGELRTAVESFVHQDACYGEIVNYVSGLIIRATSCTLHSK